LRETVLDTLVLVIGRARNLQQPALLTDGLLGMVRLGHTTPHFPPQGFSFRSKKELGRGQLPNLGVLLRHLLLVDLKSLAASAFEHAGRAFKQGAFLLMDHRRMHSEPARQFGRRLLPLQGFQRDLRFELGRVLLAFRHF
jgi:hypothetical protein